MVKPGSKGFHTLAGMKGFDSGFITACKKKYQAILKDHPDAKYKFCRSRKEATDFVKANPPVRKSRLKRAKTLSSQSSMTPPGPTLASSTSSNQPSSSSSSTAGGNDGSEVLRKLGEWEVGFFRKLGRAGLPPKNPSSSLAGSSGSLNGSAVPHQHGALSLGQGGIATDAETSRSHGPRESKAVRQRKRRAQRRRMLLEGLSLDPFDYLMVFTAGKVSPRNENSFQTADFDVWFNYGHESNLAGPAEGRQTKNAAEIQAAVKALLVANKTFGLKKVNIHTGSKFLIKCVTDYLRKWKFNGWRRTSGKQVKNRADLKALERVMAGMTIKWTFYLGFAPTDPNTGAGTDPVEQAV